MPIVSSWHIGYGPVCDWPDAMEDACIACGEERAMEKRCLLCGGEVGVGQVVYVNAFLCDQCLEANLDVSDEKFLDLLSGVYAEDH